MKSLLFIAAVSAVKLNSSSTTAPALTVETYKTSLTSALDALPISELGTAVGAAVAADKPTKDLYEAVLTAVKAVSAKEASLAPFAKLSGLKADNSKGAVELVKGSIKSINDELEKLVKPVTEAKAAKEDAKKPHAEFAKQVKEIHTEARKVLNALEKIAKHVNKADSTQAYSADDKKATFKQVEALNAQYPSKSILLWVVIGVVAVLSIGAGAFFLLRKN